MRPHLTFLVALVAVCALGLASTTAAVRPAAGPTTLTLKPLGTYRSGLFNVGGSEIVAYDPVTRRAFVSNANPDGSRVDVLDLSDPAAPTKVAELGFATPGAIVNSVAVRDGVVAAAVENPTATRQQPGRVFFFSTGGQLLKTVTVGAVPDMLTFTPNGRAVLVANEGEPNDAYTVDPEGSISIIDIANGVAGLTQANIRTVRFSDFNVGGARRGELDPQIRIFGPNASVAQDLEPEYIAVSDDSTRAWVTLQENNALAIINLATARVTELVPLGYKDYTRPANTLDVSDRDSAVNLANWPIKGMYQPDAIATYRAQNQTFLITANEGDSRDYDGYSEEERVADLALDTTAFPNAAALQADAALGRLRVTSASGNTDADPAYEELYAFGARSFSILSAAGELVYESGDDLEQIIAAAYPEQFNANNTANASFDDRSDDKGPEPEGVTIGTIANRTYAFINLERISGVMIYDVTTPTAPTFVRYINNRDFSGDPEADTAGDLGPENTVFVPAAQSPTNQPLLIVANEVSGSTTVYAIGDYTAYLPRIAQ